MFSGPVEKLDGLAHRLNQTVKRIPSQFDSNLIGIILRTARTIGEAINQIANRRTRYQKSRGDSNQLPSGP
jgi:hypothetical protein